MMGVTFFMEARSNRDMDIFEAMSTCRAMRYLKTDEVSADVIEQVITAATWAPSPGILREEILLLSQIRKRFEQLLILLRDPWLPELLQWIARTNHTG